MNTKLKQRMCIRLSMPETNSSSSHCITIFGGDYYDFNIIKKDLENMGYIIDSGKKFIIPGDGDYGRNDNDVYNDFLEKVKYASAVIYDRDSGENKKVFWDKKKGKWLEDLLKELLKVDEILLGWFDIDKRDKIQDKISKLKGKKREKELDKLGLWRNFLYAECNIIDHESSETAERLIFESKNSLRDFLTSKNSYFSCGECDVKDTSALFPKTVGNLSDRSNTLILSLYENDKIKLGGIDKIDFILHPSFELTDLYHESSDFFRTNSRYLQYVDSKTNSSNSRVLNICKWLNFIKFPIVDDWFNYTNIYSEELVMPVDSLIKLFSIYLIKKDDHFEIDFFNINGDLNEFKDKEVYVPFYLESTFKYPFELMFVKSDSINYEEIKNYIDKIGAENGKQLDQYFKNLFSKDSVIIDLIPSYDL